MAADDPLTTAARVGAILRRTVTTEEAAELIALGSAAFRTATGQTISHVAGDVAVLDSDGSWCLLLPELPVLDVSLVRLHSGGVWTTLDADTYEWSAKGILRRCAGWPDAFGKVEVTNEHGYDPVPDDVAYAVAEWVAVRMSRDPGVLSVTLGAFSQTFDRAGVTEGWTNAVKAYRVDS